MEEKTSIERFWDRLASGDYKRGLVGWYDEHNDDPNEKLMLFDGLEFPENSIALEVGCGPGRNIIKYKDLFKRIDGADISSIILEKAKEDLKENNIEIPNLYHTDGKTLSLIPSNTYDMVFMIISHQHIGSRDWRLTLYKEINRVLKPGGHFNFQTGFGTGHPVSVDYFYNYSKEDLEEDRHFDVRVEDENNLINDLEDCGFDDVSFQFTPPCHDQHPQWIWIRSRK